MGKKPAPIKTPVEIARQILSYDPISGEFRWKIPVNNGKKKPGEIAGGYSSNKKYWRVSLIGQDIRAHRLAWYMHYGEDPGPNRLVDHINGNSKDNSIDNLRLATDAENSRNRKIGVNNTTGVKGVYKRGNKYEARILDEKIDMFDTFKEATKARKKAAAETYGDFCNE